MNEFSYQQKIAIMRILLDIVNADGRIDAREVFYFNQLRKRFGLPEESQKDVNDKSSLLALAQIKMFNERQKEYLAELMANMIVVDEDIDPNEVAIYDVVREFAGIDKEFDRKV